MRRCRATHCTLAPQTPNLSSKRGGDQIWVDNLKKHTYGAACRQGRNHKEGREDAFNFQLEKWSHSILKKGSFFSPLPSLPILFPPPFNPPFPFPTL